MKFAFGLAWKNVKKRPGRSVALVLVVAFLSLTVFGGAVVVTSLKNGLDGYEARLGADVVVVPNSATSHGTLDDILLHGISGNYYMSGKDYQKIAQTEGIEKISPQFFLTSAKASCCATRVQIIGFDPGTDFSVQPWIKESYADEIKKGDLVVGANLNVPYDKKIRFYNVDYTVVAQLDKTGTGLDSAVYTTMDTIKEMAQNAAMLTEEDTFRGVDINTAVSAVMIKVSRGYEAEDVSGEINVRVTKVKATAAKNMVSHIASGLGNVSTIIGILIGVIWALSVLILIVAFVMINNERKKEFAIIRAMGSTKKTLAFIMGAEAGIVSLIGAATGLILSAIVVLPMGNALKNALELPYLLPSVGAIVGLAAASLFASVIVGVASSVVSVCKITKKETGLILREDA